MAGSATADTSATVRFAHSASVWKLGFGSKPEQPLPAPLHTLSSQPRALLEWLSEVPPTAVTYCDEAG